jgi:hypothetical protein
MNIDNEPTGREYREQIYRLFRNFVEEQTNNILNPYGS